MKSLIIYKSKHGATKEVATIIAESCGIEDVYEIDNFNTPLINYDSVIIGDHITAGKISKQVKELCDNNIEILKNKNIYLFFSGLEMAAVDKILENNFTEELKNSIKAAYVIGGKLNFPEMSFMEKSIIKVVNKKMKLIDKVDTNKCYDFLDKNRIEELITKIKTNM